MYLIALMLLGSLLGALEHKERPDIDPVYQGVWKAIVMSKDKGTTATEVDVVVARARAASVILASGDVLKVRKVADVAPDPSKDRRAANSIFFEETHTSYALTKLEDGLALLQVFNRKKDKPEELEETVRYVIRIVE